MAEAIHCPSCSTRYRLRPERLKPAIRRAKCFTCGGVFAVGDIVQRLLAGPAQEARAFSTEDLGTLPQDEFQLPPRPSPPLTLSDLEDLDADILERTLDELPATSPETWTVPTAPALEEPTLSGYTSARDAIDKLFGTETAEPMTPKVHEHSGDMDLEATLSALEATLGPVVVQQPTVPEPPSTPPADAPLEEARQAPTSSSTVRISQADILAAIAARPAAPPEAPTVMFRASDLYEPPPEERTEVLLPEPRSFASLEGPDTGAELLRLKIGEEIYGGLTMPQLISWVEEGRILDNHMIARQHSENWLEAAKVPGLRPVFERLRRERTDSAPALNPDAVEIAPKKSLFGGLFGKS